MGKISLIVAACVFILWRSYHYTSVGSWSIVPDVMAAAFVTFMMLIAISIVADRDTDANAVE